MLECDSECVCVVSASECFALNDFLLRFFFFCNFSKRRKIEAIVSGQNNRKFHAIYYFRMFGMHLDRTIWPAAVVVVVVDGGGDGDDSDVAAVVATAPTY